MKATVNTKGLKHALSLATQVMTKQHKPALPMLKHVKLYAVDRYFLMIEAASMKQGVRLRLMGDIESEGACTVSASLLKKIVALAGETVEIEHDEHMNVVSVRSGAGSTRVFSLDAEEFPGFPPSPIYAGTEIGSGVLQGLIAGVKHALCDDPARYNLTCMLLDFSEAGKLTAVGCDGRRLSAKTVELETDVSGTFMVPREIVIALTHMDATFMWLDDERIVFGGADGTIFTKPGDGTFPNWRVVVDGKKPLHVVLDRKAFIGALARAKVVTNHKFCNATFDLNGACRMKTITPEVGEYEETLESEIIDHSGDPAETPAVKIALNPDFLLPVLRTLSSEKVTLELKDQNSTARITTDDSVYVIMPIRI